jgi:uncharacterized membrane protein YbhN (UPF0104 family)
VSASPNARWWLVALRVAVSAAALWLVARSVDASAVLAQLGELRAGWVALALAVTVAQVWLLAVRWRYTAARLGLDLPLREAWGEYYLGIFVNQVLPGGVVGDVSRAWRHARSSARTGPAVRAVIVERGSAQLVMIAVAAVSALLLPGTVSSAQSLGLAAGLVAVGALVLAFLLRADPDSQAGKLLADARRACFAPNTVAFQLTTASVVVASYVAVFVIAARAVGIDSSLATIVPLIAPVLMTMLIPVTVAGWGLREGAAAALWSAAGLSAEEGAAVSVAYGLLVLVSSLPGLVVLMRTLISDPDRRARPPRA